MSAPPLVSPPTAMPTMVSRLPKFGSRPKSAATFSQMCSAPTSNTGTFTTSAAAATSTRLTNGFYHHPGPVTTAPPTSVKQNGFIRVPTSFSMKWKKENGAMEDGGGGGDTEKEWRRGKGAGQNRSGNAHQYYPPREHGSPQRSPAASQHDLKKPAASSAGKGRGFGQPASSKSSTPSPQSSPRTLPVSKSGSHSFKPGQAASGLTNGTKQVNGLSGSKPRSATNGFLRQPQSFARPGGSRPSSGPGSRSGSPLQKKPPASRSHSSDSLGSAPSVHLTESDRFRSRSLTQVRQQSSPTLPPPSSHARSPAAAARSYSNNRAAERGLKEPTASSAQAPPRGGVAKPPAGSQTPEGGGRGGEVKAQRSGVGIPSLLPPSALKKPLLPSLGSASKPSGISYKLSRPSLMKQSRPLRVTSANLSGGDSEVNGWRNTAETPSTTDNSPESTPEAPETGGLLSELVAHRELSIVGETLEDMSLSSTSSLDRNDTSQEYMDDFDNLGNGGVGILLLSSKNDEDDSGLDQSCTRFDDDKVVVNGVTKATGLCFLDDGLDWSGMRLSGERGEHQLTRLSRRRRSSQPDYHDQGGSSLDLSPSDSCGSGGTYMWDEEGLETLGGAATTASIHTNGNTTHHIGSFDSDLNSVDILNNLESCDLEDDDLMLDSDFPEDASLHSDGDGMSHMAKWRMRQLCWGTQDVHNENERSPCLSPGTPGTPGLGLDVEELAEDCSAVKSQLEYLQRLLLQEEDVDDDTLTTDTLSPEAADSSQSSNTQVQVQDLLQEVQQLREELRSRDRTIAQLTLQLSVPVATNRCRCQETTGRVDQHTQTSVTEKESVASQTPWREHTSQILHSSSQEDQEPLTDQVPAPPPPANCRSASRCPPADSIPVTVTAAQGEEDDGKRAMKKKKEEEEGETTKGRRGTYIRSLQLPQPSKLRLFLSQTSAAATATAAPLKSKAASTSSSGLSRLPKPKSY